MATGITCLVTVHGIGFQQPPIPAEGEPGYADGLHLNLSRFLDADVLSDDPSRAQERKNRGEAGPIYVSSHWPPGAESTEPGVARVGRWDPANPDRVLIGDAPLEAGGARITHVALVYSNLEDLGPQPGASIETAARALVALPRYAPVATVIKSAFLDVRAMVGQKTGVEPPPGIRVRRDKRDRPPRDQPAGILGTIRQLEDDVASYVTRNDLRQRIRGFVREVLLRLAAREDVGAIVVNGHSNGTVVGFDALRDLPPGAAAKVRWLVTAGSPLRKYVDLFAWGDEVGSIRLVPRWSNFWDPRDPVADPLALRTKPELAAPDEPSGTQGTLFDSIDPNSGAISPVKVDDVEVDNLANSAPGGLQAHNYWYNDQQFVSPLAEILGSTL